jgi:PTH2 family peptidyl-tRNA hydrolase
MKGKRIMNDVKMVIVMRTDLGMRKGKMCAQAAHAAMEFIFENNESDRGGEINTKLSEKEIVWLREGTTKIVVGVGSEKELNDLVFKAKLADVETHTITDAGRTEFKGVPTLTCAAFGPDEIDVIDKITGGLKLL